jgi:chromosome segregation ATPase
MDRDKERHNAILDAINRSKEELEALEARIKLLADQEAKQSAIVEEYRTLAASKAHALDVVHNQLERTKQHSTATASKNLQEQQAFELARVKAIETLEADKNHVTAEIRSESTKLSVLKNEYEDIKNNLAVIAIKLETATDQYQNLALQKSIATEELGKLRVEIADAESLAGATRKMITGAQESLASVKADIVKSVTERDALVQTTNDLKNEVAVLTKEIEQLRSAATIARAEHDATAALRVTMVEKQRELTQREEYLKEKYQSIGLKYE